MDRYVDITDKKYTKWLKTIATIRICIRMGIAAIMAVSLIVLLEGLAPYINGTEEWENMPFTLSQLEAIFSLIVMCWMMSKAMKVL